MEDHDQRIFRHICDNAGVGELRRVHIAHGRISVQEGKNGEFRAWQDAQNGGFRRFPVNTDEWSNVDIHRFKLLLRSRTFFAIMHSDNVQIFPERASLA